MDGNAQRLKPRPERLRVLFRQNFAGRQKPRLAAGLHRPQQRVGGHQRLAAAHVALQQPLHGPDTAQVGVDFLHGPSLCFRGRKGEPLQPSLHQRSGRRQRGASIGASPPPESHGQAQDQQFFEGQSPPGGGQPVRIVGKMQLSQGVPSGEKRVDAQDVGRQNFGHPAGKRLQSRLHDAAHDSLGQARGERIFGYEPSGVQAAARGRIPLPRAASPKPRRASARPRR